MQAHFSSSPLSMLAKICSWVFHPFVIAGPTLWYATFVTTGDVLSALGWSLFFVLLVILPLIFLIVSKLRRGHYTDADVSVRQHRFGLFFLGGICILLAWGLFTLLGAPWILGRCLIAALIALALGTFITTRTKASVHAGVSAGCAGVLFIVSPVIGLLIALAALIVGWARVYLHQHTRTQVLLGWLIAVSGVMVSFGIPGILKII